MEQARIQYEDSLEKYNKYKTLYESGAISERELTDYERQLQVHELAYKTKQQNYVQLPLSQLLEAEANFEAQKQWLKDTIAVSILDLENNIAKMQRDLMTNR